MIAFTPRPLQAVEDHYSLVEDHWKEVVADSRELCPHWDALHELESVGRLACYTMESDGEVVGYTIFVLQPDLHAKDTLVAFNDAVFVKKDHRKGKLGPQFMQYCENELRKRDINLVVWHVKPKVDYSETLKRMGYYHFSTLYAKRIN